MPVSVKLPRKHWPSFPNLCVHCGAPDPTDHFDPVSEWLLKPKQKSIAGDPITAFRPVCTRCKHFLNVELWVRRAVLCCLAIALIYTVHHQLGRNHNGWEYTDYGYAICAIVVWTVAWYLLRPAVRISTAQSGLRYTFRNKAVGHAFRTINSSRR